MSFTGIALAYLPYPQFTASTHADPNKNLPDTCLHLVQVPTAPSHLSQLVVSVHASQTLLVPVSLSPAKLYLFI